ncbi:MAG: hypothetical protein WC711_00990 [Candidatus Staskawiczbacteria bacterium]|jgi:hypothetical protein
MKMPLSSLENLIRPPLMRDIFGYFVPGFIFCIVYFIYANDYTSLILSTSGLALIWVSVAITVVSYFAGKIGMMLIDCLYSMVSFVVYTVIKIHKCHISKTSVFQYIKNSMPVGSVSTPVETKDEIVYSELLSLCQEVPVVGDYLERSAIRQIFCRSGLGLSIILAAILTPRLPIVLIVVAVSFLFLIDHIATTKSSRDMEIDIAILSEKRRQGK